MKERKFVIRLLAALLVFVMVLGLLPVIAGAENIYTNTVIVNGTSGLGTATLSHPTAAEGDVVTLTVTPAEGLNVNYQVSFFPAMEVTPNDNVYTFTQPDKDVEITVTFSPDTDNLHLNKTAVLQNDGTWTVTLEAYATGEVKTIVTRQVVPTDIILVLDQSGSMRHDEHKITAPNDTYTAVRNLPTNQQVMDGNYYYYDVNDDEYYPVKVERVISKHDTYWKYTRNGEKKSVLQSASEGIIGTSLSYEDHNVNFDTGEGFLLDNYILYKRSSSGSWGNIRYKYEAVDVGASLKTNGQIDATKLPGRTRTPVSDVRNAQTAYDNLAAAVSSFDTDMRTDSTANDYALAYIPATLVNADEYYYIFTYVDDQGQTWTKGHSDTDTGAGMNIADDTYDRNIGTLYTRGQSETYRLPVLQDAAYDFIADMRNAAIAHNVDHRIAVVGFGSDDNEFKTRADGNSGYNYDNSELLIGATQYNYYNVNDDTSNGDVLASAKYDEAFQSVNTTDGYNNLNASIGALSAKGATFPAPGFEMAKEILKLYDEDYKANKRNCIILFMTDGEPGESGYNATVANQALDARNRLVTAYPYVQIKSLAILHEQPAANMDSFLKNMSTEGSYTLATSAMDVSNFFESVDVETGTSTETVALSNNAFLVDRVSEYFNMPANTLAQQQENETDDAYKARIAAYLTKHVKVYTAEHMGNLEFANPLEQKDYHKDTSWANESDCRDHVHVWPTWSADGTSVRGITAHNFDFTSLDNMVRTEYKLIYDQDGDGVWDDEDGDTYGIEAHGRKLIIEISGITAKTDAALGYYVPTNNTYSGLWDQNSTADGGYGLLKAFPMPIAQIYNKTYVLDYAEKAMLNTASEIRTAKGIAVAANGAIPGFSTTDTGVEYTIQKSLAYGVASIETIEESDGTGKVPKGKLYYSPTTMKWDDYDTMYIFWDSTHTDAEEHPGIGDPVTGNGWSRVNVLPANNVYYEDSFVSKDDSNNDTGLVGIEFGGDWDVVFDGSDTDKDNIDEDVTTKPETGADDNTELPEEFEDPTDEGTQGENGGVHGWVDDLAKDDQFSDGSAHVANAGATATFTFTGTGVDIYTRTNLNSGMVIATLSKEGQTAAQKLLIVDNLAVSGDYYQVPTLSFMDLEHGDYTVKIIVTSASALTPDVNGNPVVDSSNKRSTYYLDGIRIYNPLGLAGENDPVVDSAYGDDELKANFLEIRDVLISANTITFVNGDQSQTMTAIGGSLKELPVPTKTGFTFLGWFTAEDGGVQVTADSEFTEDCTYYAQWSPIRVAFDAGEGTPVGDATVDTSNGKLTVALPTPTRDGYDFAGWYNGNELVNQNTIYVQDVTLVAHWIKQHKITLDLGYEVEGRLSETVTYLGRLTADKLYKPTRDGYVFLGWSTTEDTTNSMVRLNTVFDHDATVYACWAETGTEIVEYTVKFDSDGGTMDSTPVQTMYGSLNSLPVPTKAGFTFAGWFDANGAEVTWRHIYTADTTLTARWNEVQNQVAAVSDDGSIAPPPSNGSTDTGILAKNGVVFIDWIQPQQGEETGDAPGVGVKTYKIGTYEDLGPKNEVYLSAGQSVVFKVDTTSGNKYYVGLKSLNGEKATAELLYNDTAKKEVSIEHSTDMYYELTPNSEGLITIANAGESEGILSITKLRTTNPAQMATDGGIEEIPVETAVAFARTFARMSVYTPPTQSDPDHVEDSGESEQPGEGVTPEPPKVEIDNPDPEPDVDPEPEGPSFVEQLAAQIKALVSRLFNSMRNWLNG